MKPVYYLSYSNLTSEVGLVFPNEVPVDSYSTGLWVVETNKEQGLENLYEFDVVENNEVNVLLLSRTQGNLFVVESSKHGIFYFRADLMFNDLNSYVGQSKLFDKSSHFFQIVPLDEGKLSRVCKESNFFFVGRIDESLEPRNK